MQVDSCSVAYYDILFLKVDFNSTERSLHIYNYKNIIFIVRTFTLV